MAWPDRRRILLGLVSLALALAAAGQLGSGFRRLLPGTDPRVHPPPVDLEMRQRQVRDWLAGRPVYGDPQASYPPASMLLLYPWLGWGSTRTARLLFAGTNAVLLAALAWLFAREAGGSDPAWRLSIALLPLAGEAAGATLVLGQVGVLSLVPALVSVWLARSRAAGPRRRLACGGLMLVALLKPAIAAPFWLLLLAWLPGTAVAVGAAYLGLTLAASGFQDQPALALVRSWLAPLPAWTLRMDAGYGSLPVWIARDLSLPMGLALGASAGCLCALALWLLRRPEADPWRLIGATALVARLWTVHRLYDDLVALPALVPLSRLVHDEAAGRRDRRLAEALVWLLGLASLLPRGRSLGQPLAWLLALAFIVNMTRGSRRR